MLNLRDIATSGFALSVVFHLVTGVSLALVHFKQKSEEAKIAIETIFDSERLPEEFTRELNSDTEVSETLNITPGGGSVTGAVVASMSGGGGGNGGGGGLGGTGVATGKIDASG